MVKTSINTILASKLRALDERGLLKDIAAVYLFGSAQADRKVRDIDLLVVWDENTLTPLRAAELRPMLVRGLRHAIDLPVHIMLLSGREAASSRFAELESAEIVFERQLE